MTPPIQVSGDGPSDAKIVFLGEAPGGHEVERGLPFVGPSGKILWSICEEFGLKRAQVYVTNVVKIRCPGDTVKRIKETGHTIEEYLPLMWSEIDAIKPNVILALGNTALGASTGIIDYSETGILKYRGSILPSARGGYKIVATIHPAMLLRGEDKELSSWKQIQFLRFDIDKCIKQSHFPEIKYRPRQLHIAYSAYQIENFFRKYEYLDDPLLFSDIETFKAIPICISFSFTPEEGISIPLVNLLKPGGQRTEITTEELARMWKMVIWALGKYRIAGQNFYNFDINVLERWGFRIPNLAVDTILASGVVYPELPKSQAFTTSIYTDEPYYKNEGKEYNPKKDNPEVLLRYNCKDSIIDCEIWHGQARDIKELGLEDFFYNFMMKLPKLYRGIESVGLKVDFEQKEKLKKSYELREKETLDKLWVLSGERVNPSSPKQVSHFIFGTLGCPIRKDTTDETLSALQTNVLSKSSKWDTAITCIDLILDYRKLRKTRSTYILAEPDLDGRIRTSYRLDKETGRTSTKILQKPVRHRKFGLPFHNITKHSDIGGDVRSMFIPDEDCVFLEADQSQAEARTVLLLAKEYGVLELFDKLDIHCLTAGWIYNCDWTDIKKLEETDPKSYNEKRQLGKTSRHAGGYDQTVIGLAKKANIKIKKAERVLDIFHKFTPGIRKVFHEEVKEFLANNDCCLYTPFGRFRKFYNKWGDDLFREAYAHINQSTIADNTKRCMLAIKKEYSNLRICIESHDGFTSIVPRDTLLEVAKRIKYYMEMPIDFSKCSLSRPEISIPCEFKVGYNNLEKMERLKL